MHNTCTRTHNPHYSFFHGDASSDAIVTFLHNCILPLLRCDLSSSLQFMVSAYCLSCFAFVVGILLSPGCLNQDTITLRSSRFQCLGIAPFVLACSTLCLASASACCHLLLAANAFFPSVSLYLLLFVGHFHHSAPCV